MTEPLHQHSGLFTEALTRYQSSRHPYVLSLLTAATAFPYDICGIVSKFLVPDKIQFAALVLDPSVVIPDGFPRNIEWDIVQHGTLPSVKRCFRMQDRRPMHEIIGIKDLDVLLPLAVRLRIVPPGIYNSPREVADMLSQALSARIGAFFEARLGMGF